MGEIDECTRAWISAAISANEQLQSRAQYAEQLVRKLEARIKNDDEEIARLREEVAWLTAECHRQYDAGADHAAALLGREWPVQQRR